MHLRSSFGCHSARNIHFYPKDTGDFFETCWPSSFRVNAPKQTQFLRLGLHLPFLSFLPPGKILTCIQISQHLKKKKKIANSTQVDNLEELKWKEKVLICVITYEAEWCDWEVTHRGLLFLSRRQPEDGLRKCYSFGPEDGHELSFPQGTILNL